MPSLKTIVATGLALLLATVTNGLPMRLVARNPPEQLPENATANDKKFQPAVDFDTDSCYNTPAISPDGEVAHGLPHDSTGASKHCHDPSDLMNNNVYSRARCNNGWCVYLYDYYFEKDVALTHNPFDPGHTHDWEHIAVWVQDGEPKYVSGSAHLRYNIRPASEVRWEGTHPKMIYHKDGSSTHCFRFAREDDEQIENASGMWFFGSLVSWDGFPSTHIRDILSSHDFGSAHFALRDDNFPGNLDRARENLVPEFDINKDEDSPGDP